MYTNMRTPGRSIDIYQGDLGEEGEQYTVMIQISNKGVIWGTGFIKHVSWHCRQGGVFMPPRQRQLYRNALKSAGICLICGELDFSVFEEHHIDRTKLPNFTITVCGNCHNRFHWFNGKQFRTQVYTKRVT